MNDSADLIQRLLAVTAIMASVAISLTVTHRRNEARLRREADGLRAVLEVELTILLGAWETCLRRLDAGEEMLFSCRAMTVAYRSSVARMRLLRPAEVTVVAQAFAFVEAIEAFLAGSARQQGAAWRVLPGEAPVVEIRGLYREGCARAEHALAMLGAMRPVDHSPPARERAAVT